MRTLIVVCGVSVATLLLGGILLAAFGYDPPGRLLACEVALFSLTALAVGFGANAPKLPAWMRLRPVRGAACVVLGVGAMYVPPQFIVSAFFIGLGTRLVWASACELADADGPNAAGTAIIRAEAPPVVDRWRGNPSPSPAFREHGDGNGRMVPPVTVNRRLTGE